MSNNDPRPGYGGAPDLSDEASFQLPARETLEGKSVQEVAFEVVKLNPTFSFADATAKAEELLASLAPAVDELPPVVDVAPAPTRVSVEAQVVPAEKLPAESQEFRSTTEPAPIADSFPKTEVQQPVAAQPAQAPQAPVDVQPRAPHVHSSPILSHPQPEQPAPEPALDEDTPLDRDEQQPNIAVKPRRPMNFGSQPLRSEVSEMDKEDPQRILLQSDELLGTHSQLAGEQEVMKFFSGIPRNRDGRPMFRSAAEEERYQKLFTALDLTPPIMINGRAAFDIALEREDTTWQQTIQLPDGKYSGPVTDRGANAQGALAALRRRRRSGSPVSVWLPATGIYVGFKAPHENDMCDFDIRITSEQSKIGMYTYGLLLAASSGVYLQHMVDHSLNFAVDTTYDCQGNDLKTTLMDVVDLDDYWLLVIGPLMAKFPAGIPWKLLCPNIECNHEREVRLNLARCIRMADGLFTDMHRAMWLRQRGKGPDAVVGNEDYLAYRKELPRAKSSIYRNDEAGVTVEFGRSTIGQFIDSTNAWVEKINVSATNALAGHATETERSQYIRLTAETRRLTRYATHVKSITVEEIVKGESVETRETDPERIYDMLEELSSDRGYVVQFEDALSTYNEEARMAVFGYMGHACPSCSTKEGEEEGPFRGIVTISPDKVFFALSRVVFEIQKVYLQQFESIG